MAKVRRPRNQQRVLQQRIACSRVGGCRPKRSR